MAGTLRCPENYVPVRLPPLPYKSDTTNWDFPKTTVEESYPYPKKKKPIVTREGRFEQFIWHEMYAQYVASATRRNTELEAPKITEYKDQFGKAKTPETSEKQREEMINHITEYPVYGSEAISYWNPKGRQPNSFKCVYTITKPVALQETQFG